MTIDIGDYLDELEIISSRVKKQFNVWNIELDNDQLCKLLSFAKHCTDWIAVGSCVINSIIVPDFGNCLDGYKCNGLDFSGSGRRSRSNWEENPQLFENVIIGLSKVNDVKNGLY